MSFMATTIRPRTRNIVISAFDFFTRRVSLVTADDGARLRPTAEAVPGRVMINDYEKYKPYETCCGASWFEEKKRPRRTTTNIVLFHFGAASAVINHSAEINSTAMTHCNYQTLGHNNILIYVSTERGTARATFETNTRLQSDRRKIGFLVRRCRPAGVSPSPTEGLARAYICRLFIYTYSYAFVVYTILCEWVNDIFIITI